MDQKKHGLSRDLIIHPGETLAEILDDRGMSQKELSIRTGVTEKHVSSIIKGKSSISNAYSKKLEYALNIPAGFWSNLQANYDQELLEYEDMHHISEAEISVLSSLKDIVQYLCKISLIDSTDNEAGRILSLRKLLGVSNLTVIPNITFNGAYRAQTSVAIDANVVFAWQALCERLTDHIEVSNFAVEKLINVLPSIKALMFQPAHELQKGLVDIFSECGIAFAIVPNFKGAPVQGFIKRCEATEKIILCMTIRGKFADRFWFTLFHEIGHLINGDIKQMFIDFEKVSSIVEEKANIFGKNALINEANYEVFVQVKNFSYSAICDFAAEEGVQPYIVIGRLENDRHIDYRKFAGQKVKYMWIDH